MTTHLVILSDDNAAELFTWLNPLPYGALVPPPGINNLAGPGRTIVTLSQGAVDYLSMPHPGTDYADLVDGRLTVGDETVPVEDGGFLGHVSGDELSARIAAYGQQ